MTRLSYHLLKQFLWVVLACVPSYFWIDRPLAIWMSKLNARGEAVLGNANLASGITSLLYLLFLGAMLCYAYERVVLGKFTRKIQCMGLICLAVPISFFIKAQLQYFFGRLSPRYDGQGVLLFVRNPHLYGFHFFQVGCFPSGHMCVFTAMLWGLVYFYPRLKPLVISALGVLAGLLVFYNYHFLSDVIAGAYVGFLVVSTLYRVSVLNEMQLGQSEVPIPPMNL